MDVPKLPRFRKAIEDLQDYVSTLSQKEKIATNMENFDYENYEQAATPMKNRQYMPDELAETDRIHEVHCRTMIEVLKEDIAKYHLKENGEDLPSKIPKLLARYIKLPDLWRSYICTRLDPKDKYIKSIPDDEDNKDKPKTGNSKGDRWIFGFFAMVVTEDEDGGAWDKELNEKMLIKFESTINEIERAVITSPSVIPTGVTPASIEITPLPSPICKSTLPESF